MAVHIGNEIKKIAKAKRIGPTELAKEISTSKQNIYGIYNRKSIDTELLYKISLALEHNFFELYNTTPGVLMDEQTKYYSADDVTYLREELSQLKKELVNLKEKYQLQVKINALLEKK